MIDNKEDVYVYVYELIEDDCDIDDNSYDDDDGNDDSYDNE